jgi:hypothetical protein
MHRFAAGLLVAVWTFLAFLPVLANDFVNWDDLRMFLDNAAHRGSWRARLQGAWASNPLGEYMPVTWMSFGLDRTLFELDARGYHLTSLVLHVATALGVFALAWRLLELAMGPRVGRTGSWAARRSRR